MALIVAMRLVDAVDLNPGPNLNPGHTPGPSRESRTRKPCARMPVIVVGLVIETRRRKTHDAADEHMHCLRPGHAAVTVPRHVELGL